MHAGFPMSNLKKGNACRAQNLVITAHQNDTYLSLQIHPFRSNPGGRIFAESHG